MPKTNPNRSGEFISHATMGVVGLLLILGGYKCLRAAYRVGSDLISNQQQNQSGGVFLAILLIGIALILVGALLCLGAVVPTSWLERMFSPPSATLGEEPADSSFWRALSWIIFWW